MAPLVVARASTQLAALLGSVLVARRLGAEALGIYTAVVAVSGVFVGGTTSGLPVLVTRRTATGSLSKTQFGRLLALGAGIGGAAALGAVATSVAVTGWSDGLRFGPLGALAFLLLAGLTILAAVGAGLRRFGLVAAAEGCGGLATVGLIALALELGWGLGGAFAAMVIGPALGASVLAPVTAGMGGESRGPQVTLSELVPFIALGAAYSGYLRVDAILLGPIAGATSLGQYAAAYRVLGVFALLGSSFGTVFFPRLSADPDDRDLLRRATATLVLLVLPVAGALFAGAPFVLRTVFGPEFEVAAAPLRILLLSVVPYAFYWPMAHSLNARGCERSVAKVLVTAMVLDITLVALLGPGMGARGAAWAWVATETTTLVACHVVLTRRWPRDRRPA